MLTEASDSVTKSYQEDFFFLRVELRRKER